LPKNEIAGRDTSVDAKNNQNNFEKNGTFLRVKNSHRMHHVFAHNTTTPPQKTTATHHVFAKPPIKNASKAWFFPRRSHAGKFLSQ